MNSELSPIQQRWLAVGLLCVVVLIFVLLIIVPLVSKSLQLNDQEKTLLFRLQQYERILAQKDNVTASMAKIQQQHDAQGYFNSKETAALASAEMQEFIKKTIVDAGGQLSSTQTIPATIDPNNKDKDKFERIVVRIRMTANSEKLRTILYKIETSTPFIIIDQIDIRPMRGQRNLTTHQMDSSNELNVNFQAVSFMRKPAQ